MISYTNYKNTYPADHGLTKNMFYNPETLNIFTDSSLSKGRAYGAIFVNQNDLLFKDIREESGNTNNVLELMGIRLALGYIPRLSPYYAYINIFSDSAYALEMLKDGVFKWTFNGNQYLDRHGNVAKNQDILLEITNILLTLVLRYNIRVNLMFVPSHVGTREYEMHEALRTFSRMNNVSKNTKVDINLVRYLCLFNNYIDREVRNLSMISAINDKKFEEAITFYPAYTQV